MDSSSLSPKEKTTSYFRKRSISKKDPVDVMAELWEKSNARQSWLNHGIVPLDFITHGCNDKCVGTEGNYVQHHFPQDEEFNDRDVRVAAATVRWLATNVGRGFLYSFFKEIGLPSPR